jgi:DNA-binding response OmpR family regulator
MPKVLIIEDRRDNIVFIANNILKPLGYDIITARDGQIGLTKAQQEEPDLIITDLKLPKMGGLDVLEQLAEKGVNIPAIVMTFHGSENTAMRALRLGARDYLIKPFTVEEMHQALDRALKPAARGGPKEAEYEARVSQLEQELAEAQAALARHEKQVKQMQTHFTDTAKKSELVEMTQQAEAWEKDNARLSEILAETKDKLNKAEGRANDLEQAMETQKVQMDKYRQEAKRLAEELRNLSESVRLMSQNLAHQVERLEVLTPGEEEDINFNSV